MICVQRALVAVAALFAACNSPGSEDPCAGASTCVRVDVDSFIVQTIDQLVLDLVYEGVHATTTTRAAGPMDLPLTTAIILDLPTSPLIEIDVVAVGKLGGALLGTDAASTTVQQGHHATLSIDLQPTSRCTEGALYCGGRGDIAGQSSSLYRCTAGIPLFYARCSSYCSSVGDEGVCSGSGLCRDGGTYCGGHMLDGDPFTLYVCNHYDGTEPTECPDGCAIRGDGNDACK